MRRIETTRPIVGIAHMQVCSVKDATDEEILKWCNTDNPSGTSDFEPVQCESFPDRFHIMVSC